MAFRNFDADLTRRSLLRGSGYLAAGGFLAASPMGPMALGKEADFQWSKTTQLLSGYVSSGKVANIVTTLGFGKQDPAVLKYGTLGFGSSVRADADSLYRIYSMTKPITGMAAMILVDEGKLGLDQPIAEIIPGFADMRVLKTPTSPLTDTVAAERPITVRNLLTHTAGLGYDIVSKGPILEAYRKYGILGGQVSRMAIPGITDVEAAPGLASFVDRVARLPLVYQPGKKWSYSIGLDVLGRVIEVAAKQNFAEFLQQRIFDPAGMDSTFFKVPASERSRLTDNYFLVGGAPMPIDPAAASVYLDEPRVEWGGSGLVSSARDYDRFLEMLLGYGMIGGKRVMSEAAVRMGTSNLLPEGASTENTFVSGQGFGAGGRVSNGAYGWGGAAGTAGFADFAHGLRGTMMTQYMPSEAYKLTEQFIASVTGDLTAMAGA